MITNNLGITNINSTANKATNQKEDPKLLAACQEFESVFINQLLTQMRSTLPKDGLFEEDSGEDVYKSMLDQEYSKQMSEAGGIGLAKMLYDQIKTNSPAE